MHDNQSPNARALGIIDAGQIQLANTAGPQHWQIKIRPFSITIKKKIDWNHDAIDDHNFDQILIEIQLKSYRYKPHKIHWPI